jgi:hypothetical protein
MKLSKELFNRAKKLDIVSFTLNWEGGSDQGYLYVDYEIASKRLNGESRWKLRETKPEYHQALQTWESDIENWAHETFAYNGAGDGTRYGDVYEYNLVEKTVTHQEWWMTREEGARSSDTMETQ